MIATQLKVSNRKEVFDYMRTKHLRTGEDSSRAEISKQIGISAPTLMKIADFLLGQDLLEMGEEVVVSVGRPSQMLRVKSDCMYAVGFLLEGDYLYMGVVNIFGMLVYRKVLEVEPNLLSVMQQVKEQLVMQLLEEARIPAAKLVGIGLAMPVSYNVQTKVISDGRLVKIDRELYIGDYLEELEQLYQVPVFFENDANAECLGASYLLDSFAQKSDILLFSIGTGIGAALMLEGRLRRGYSERCGEIGGSVLGSFDDFLPENTLEGQISLGAIYREHGLSGYAAFQELTDDMRMQIIDKVARKLAVAIYDANNLVDCKDVIICGHEVELLGKSLLEAVDFYLEKLMPDGKPHCVRTVSPFAGIAGISGLCIEHKIGEILER